MRSKKALLMLAAMFLLLTGCGAPLLSERAVVRAVCFRGAAQAARVSLVLEAAGQEDAFQTVTGRGASYAAAFKDAERQLDGAVFYGLMDLALLPPQAGWEQAAEIGQLLADTALPAPKIDVFC